MSSLSHNIENFPISVYLFIPGRQIVNVDIYQWYFTSQLDINLNGNFISCASGKKVKEGAWHETEPNNYGGREACGLLGLARSYNAFVDGDCYGHRVACEVSDRPLVCSGRGLTYERPTHPTRNIKITNDFSCTNKKQ